MANIRIQIPFVAVLENLEITTDQVSDQLEVEEESLLATGSVESLKRALDQLEMENGTDPTFSQLEGYQGFLCESMTVECCIPSFLNENARDQVSCRLEVDEESLVDTGSIESLTAGFDETEDTVEPGSSCFIEPKTLEPNTPCLFSKKIVNTTETGPSLAAVDEESLNEIISVDTYTCCAVEMRTEDDMVKGSDSMNDKARLKEQIKVLQQQLYEKEVTIQTQGKRLEKLTEALSEMESQQYQKDATIKAQKEEIDALRANQIPQLPSEPSKVNQIFQFVRRVGFHVGSTIVKYNLISHM
ncbi:PREDICTED: uncharacterized protein LOC107358297 [Acropora digitifera]|uniref:uncharacterized protein LOC107358297 n=1 Tax=Acropora digitifera TaxID=70779 RepID=UPI00077AB170|nr:PREDICTED: uncharacterized protein LOC107358297 [Acropora digitifera]